MKLFSRVLIGLRPISASRRAVRAMSVVSVMGAALMAALPMGLTGCGARVPFISAGPGTIRVESLGERPVVLSGRFDTAIYGDAEAVETTFLLSDVPMEDVISGRAREAQVLHVEVLWLPRPGWTPLSADATNVSVRYVVISDGEIGIYGGAGFATLSGSIGSKKVAVSLRDASLKLLEGTSGFNDLLTPARISGNFTATHEPRRTRQMHYELSQFVTDTFGRSLFVLEQTRPMQDRPPLALR